MKIFSLIIILSIIANHKIYSREGEIWFYIDNNQNHNYMVVAKRISLNDPLFGENFMEVNSTQYDIVISDEPRFESWLSFDFYLGFDYLRDQGNYGWPFIGEGKIEFSIYTHEDPTDNFLVFRFGIDLVHYPNPPLTFHDFTFLYSQENNTMIALTNGIYTEIMNNSFVNSWELQGMQREISSYVKNVELTNFLATGPEPDIKTIFTTATMGFPDPENFQTGEEYPPGTVAPLWCGVFYGLTVSQTTYSKNNVIYNFRNWFETENFSSSTIFRIEDETDEFISMFQPTYPLTVSNYLEGGSLDNNYQLTWYNPEPDIVISWQFGTTYNAFRYPINADVYSITSPSTFQGLGTTWNFYKWNDGLANNVKSNLQIMAPTTYTANYKGQFRSDDQNGISSCSQRKLIRTDNGIYHCIYESMGEVWYTHSLTTNFNGAWSQDYSINEGQGQARNPSIDFEGNKIKIVMEFYDPYYWSEAVIFLMTWEPDVNGNYYLSDFEDVKYYSPSYFGNAKPVISYTNVVLFIAYRKNTSDGLYQMTKWNDAGNWVWGTEGTIPNTNLYSSNPSVCGFGDDIYLAWQHSLGIRYIFGGAQGTNWRYANYEIISTGSGYQNNYSPSISLAKNGYPVVSWIGYNYTDPGGGGINKIEGESPTSKIVVRRASGSSWSSFFKAGYNAVTTNNNSTSSALNEESVITWSEGTSPNFLSKWVRRVNGSYTDAHSLSHNGKQNQVSNGTTVDNMEGTVFTITQLPYMLSLVTTDFNQQFVEGGGINKVGDVIELSYGREGVIYKNGVEFLFNIGDIIVGDSVIKFIEQPDTILYSSAEELNAVVKTVPFNLSPSTEFYFTDFYYVLNDSLADTALTAIDVVNFKVELVNNQSGQVVGIFDNVIYTRENLIGYANASYQVDCNSIIPGEYYLRLVTAVEGEAEYHLGNVQNSSEELDKHNYQQINFSGTDIPVSYKLEQNYPNPFNPTTTIRYQIPKDGMVTLKVYDLLGAEVVTLVSEELVSGKYEVNFNASRLASGVYLYKLQADEFISVKKMILLK
jgi:hypothetical protein